MWYLNESGLEVIVSFIQNLDSDVISSLTLTEMHSLLSRLRRMCDLTAELELLLFAVFLEDIERGKLKHYPVDARLTEASNLIARYPDQLLLTREFPLYHLGFPSGNPDARHR